MVAQASRALSHLGLHLQHQHLLQELRRVGIAAEQARKLLQLHVERRVGVAHEAHPVVHEARREELWHAVGACAQQRAENRGP